MKAKKERKTKISFPLGLYFQQLIYPNTYVRTIDPFTFWHRYKIKHLETCWEINLVSYLERCRKLEWQPSLQQQERDIELFIGFSKKTGEWTPDGRHLHRTLSLTTEGHYRVESLYWFFKKRLAAMPPAQSRASSFDRDDKNLVSEIYNTGLTVNSLTTVGTRSLMALGLAIISSSE